MLGRTVECSPGCLSAVEQSAGFVLLEWNPSCVGGSIEGIGPSCKSCSSPDLGSGAHLTLALRSPENFKNSKLFCNGFNQSTSGEFFLPTEEYAQRTISQTMKDIKARLPGRERSTKDGKTRPCK